MNPEVPRARETKRGVGGEALRTRRGEAHGDPCQAQGRQVPGHLGSALRVPSGSGFSEQTCVRRLSVPGCVSPSESHVCHGAGPRHGLCFCHWEGLCVWFGVSGCVCVGCVSVLPGTSVHVSFPCGWRARVSAGHRTRMRRGVMALCSPKRGVPGATVVSGDQCVTLCEVSVSLCQGVPVCCCRRLLICASQMWSDPALCVLLFCVSVCSVCLSGCCLCKAVGHSVR